MSGKSKASDRTNLLTINEVAPMPTILSSLSLQFFFFLEQPFYENYPTLYSRDTRPFTCQDGFQNRHKVYSVAYGSTKIVSFIFQNNEYSLPLLFCQPSSNQTQNILYIPCFRVFRIFGILQYSMYSAIPPNRVTQRSGRTS